MSPIKGTVNRMKNMLGINSYQGIGDSEEVRFVGSAGTNSYHKPSLHHKMKDAGVNMMHKAKTSMHHAKTAMMHKTMGGHMPMMMHKAAMMHKPSMMHKAKDHATSMMKMPFNMVSFIAGPGMKGASEAAKKAATAVKNVAPSVGGTRAVKTSPKTPGKKSNRMMMGGMGLVPKAGTSSYQGYGNSEKVKFVGAGGIDS